MGRLIDADELLARIGLNYNNHQNVSAGAIKDIIGTTKTAYDVEKVVEGIHDYFAEITYDCDSDYILHELLKYHKEICNIIRKGGIDE